MGDTINTLNFAGLAKSIENRPVANERGYYSTSNDLKRILTCILAIPVMLFTLGRQSHLHLHPLLLQQGMPDEAHFFQHLVLVSLSLVRVEGTA